MSLRAVFECRQTGIAALAAYPQRRTFVLGVNWCLLPGINDSRAETDRFLAWLREEGLEAGPRSARGGSIMAGCGQLGGRAEARRSRLTVADGDRT